MPYQNKSANKGGRPKKRTRTGFGGSIAPLDTDAPESSEPLPPSSEPLPPQEPMPLPILPQQSTNTGELTLKKNATLEVQNLNLDNYGQSYNGGRWRNSSHFRNLILGDKKICPVIDNAPTNLERIQDKQKTGTEM